MEDFIYASVFLSSKTICEGAFKAPSIKKGGAKRASQLIQRTLSYLINKYQFISIYQVTLFSLHDPMCFQFQSITLVWSHDVVIKTAECCLEEVTEMLKGQNTINVQVKAQQLRQEMTQNNIEDSNPEGCMGVNT